MSDAASLFSWRNDPLTRQMSESTRPVGWSEHLAWLSRAVADPTRDLFVAELTARALGVGTARIDRHGDRDEVSWTIAPEFRGLGFGRALIRNLIFEVGDRPAFARIKPENAASRRMARGCGFARLGVVDGVEVWLHGPAGAGKRELFDVYEHALS